MNANQIINMVMRIVMRRAINSGINAGFNAMSKQGSNRGKPRQGGQPRADDGEKMQLTPEERAKIRAMRQARRAARQNRG